MICFGELGSMELRCGFGGGSGGGGGAGAVDYPTYMKDWHQTGLGTWSGSGVPNFIAVMQAKIGHSPFAALSAYDPQYATSRMESSVDRLKSLVDSVGGADTYLLIPTLWASLADAVVAEADNVVFSNAAINADIAAYNATVDAEILNSILPRFHRGMQDINAVCSSAFIVGEALIEAEALRNKDKYAADLRLQNYKERTSFIVSGIGEMVRVLNLKFEYQARLTASVIEKERLEIIAMKEQTDVNMHIDELDYKSDLELFAYAGNFLAAIGSASVRTGAQSNPTASAIGGIMGGVGALMMGASMLI